MEMNRQRIIMIGATLGTVAVTAFLMQSGRSAPRPEASAAAMAAASAAPLPAPVPVKAKPAPVLNEVVIVAAVTAPIVEEEPAPVVIVGNDLPRPPSDMLTPVLPSTSIDLHDRVAVTSEPSADPIVEEPRANQFGLTCGPILSAAGADAAGNAMVHLTLTAPCHGDEQVTVRNGDLAFSARLDPLGTLTAEVPALSRQARFTVTFADETETTTQADLPGAGQIERVALVHRGETGLQIHALEFGADYGDRGHVWAEASRDADEAALMGGGFLTVLGDPTLDQPYMAQVYSYPSGTRDIGGVIRLSVEAEVTAFNCDTEVQGRVIEPGPSGEADTVEMTVAIPDCSAIGEYLVLKNLLRDLRIASN